MWSTLEDVWAIKPGQMFIFLPLWFAVNALLWFSCWWRRHPFAKDHSFTHGWPGQPSLVSVQGRRSLTPFGVATLGHEQLRSDDGAISISCPFSIRPNDPFHLRPVTPGHSSAVSHFLHSLLLSPPQGGCKIQRWKVQKVLCSFTHTRCHTLLKVTSPGLANKREKGMNGMKVRAKGVSAEIWWMFQLATTRLGWLVISWNGLNNPRFFPPFCTPFLIKSYAPRPKGVKESSHLFFFV